ncbi:hypothetical protein [Serratia liquefaciens]|uniref:hypothetical protein n=1 Tax=Serratia liquefaciens TaxID=614 RepID=UPI0039069C97
MNNITKELITSGHSLAKEMTGVASVLVRELATQLDVQHVRADLLAAENAYLLPKAASELSNAWMLHKYWVGINAALMHIWAGRQPDAVAWLENTVSGPGIDAPEFTNSREIEEWASDQQKDSISHAKALEIIKEKTPTTNVALAAERSMGIEQAVSQIESEYGEHNDDIVMVLRDLREVAIDLREAK